MRQNPSQVKLTMNRTLLKFKNNSFASVGLARFWSHTTIQNVEMLYLCHIFW